MLPEIGDYFFSLAAAGAGAGEDALAASLEPDAGLLVVEDDVAAPSPEDFGLALP